MLWIPHGKIITPLVKYMAAMTKKIIRIHRKPSTLGGLSASLAYQLRPALARSGVAALLLLFVAAMRVIVTTANYVATLIRVHSKKKASSGSCTQRRLTFADDGLDLLPFKTKAVSAHAKRASLLVEMQPSHTLSR